MGERAKVEALQPKYKAENKKNLKSNSCFCTANFVGDTYIPRLEIVTVPKGYWEHERVAVATNYTYLLGYCVQQPPLSITWLSNIPDHLISRILCFLPLKQAAKTSILSKRWRYLWSSMPNLSISVPTSAVTNVLKLYKPPSLGFLDFSTIIHDGKFPTSQEIDLWLSLASSLQVEDVILRLEFLGFKKTAYHLGSDLAFPAFSTLKRLTLYYCMLSPNAAKNLNSLEFLALERVDLDDDTIDELTSSCSMLGELVLRECNSKIPLRISITNPKTSKLTIKDSLNGYDELLLELSAPYLLTLTIVSDIPRRYNLKVPSLSTLKISRIMRFIDSDYQKAALLKILNGIEIRELYLSSAILHLIGKKWTIHGPNSHIKVKHLHLQILNLLPLELPGLIYLIDNCDGIETLVFDFDYTYYEKDKTEVDKRLKYLNSHITSNLEEYPYDESVFKDKLKLVHDEDHWNSLKSLLSSKMLDLKCVKVNFFKRVLKIEKASNSVYGSDSCYRAVDKYEFKLLRILLCYSMGLESLIIRPKDLYYIEEVDNRYTKAYKCKNIYINGEVDKLEISHWDKILLSFPKISPRTKINVIGR